MFGLYDLDPRGWKRWRAVADQCQRHLTEQQIALGNPGTILKDVDTWLEFVGPGGIVTKSRNASLPAERLPALNLEESGDCWQFEVRLEKIDAGVCRLRQPKVIESVGKAPEQYPQFEE